MVASGCIRPPHENFSLRKLEDSHVFTERHRYAGQMLRRIRCAVFVHFASDSDSRCLSFFTHRENLPGVHRHAEQAHLRATTRWHALCLIPSQSDRHKQPQWTICQIVRKVRANEETKKIMLTATRPDMQ